MTRRSALLCVAALCVTACGSGGVTATATQGDAFCALAQKAKADSDSLDSIDATDPAAVKLELGAAIDTLSAAAAKAPRDIAVTVKALLSTEEALEKLLQDNGYDIVKMSQSAEGKKLIDDASKSTVADDFDTYLGDRCGITTANTTLSDTTTS